MCQDSLTRWSYQTISHLLRGTQNLKRSIYRTLHVVAVAVRATHMLTLLSIANPDRELVPPSPIAGLKIYFNVVELPQWACPLGSNLVEIQQLQRLHTSLVGPRVELGLNLALVVASRLVSHAKRRTQKWISSSHCILQDDIRHAGGRSTDVLGRGYYDTRFTIRIFP
jgi:hypothetical protein